MAAAPGSTEERQALISPRLHGHGDVLPISVVKRPTANCRRSSWWRRVDTTPRSLGGASHPSPAEARVEVQRVSGPVRWRRRPTPVAGAAKLAHMLLFICMLNIRAL